MNPLAENIALLSFWTGFMPKKRRFRSRIHPTSNESSYGGDSRPRPSRPRGKGRGYGGRRGPGTGAGPGGGGGGGGDDRDVPPQFDDAPLPEGAEEIPLQEFVGILEMHPNGYGFLRSPENNYSRERTDPFVPGTMIEKFGLRQGVKVTAMMQQARRQQGPRVREIVQVDGIPPEEYCNIKPFDQQTPINPEQWLKLEVGQQPLTNRIIDLLAPLGRGQRALIVAPPRSGKTIMLQHISRGIATNYPEVHLIVLLIDERPEEVTDMRRNVLNGEVIASSLDEDVDSHVRLSQLVIDRCKRLAEAGQDVFLLMDSITRLARAFNKWVGNSGPTMTGGVNIKAMDIPKKLFATARAFENGGSLTIVGTALVDTGSRMDELIFQEFKGTGNMELVLDRRLADRRVWPAIDISQSGTRREELLHDPETLHAVTMIRRTLNSMHPVEAMEQLTKQLARFPSNAEFLRLIGNARLD
jgi:transcription termination factor Rho